MLLPIACGTPANSDIPLDADQQHVQCSIELEPLSDGHGQHPDEHGLQQQKYWEYGQPLRHVMIYLVYFGL